MSNEAPPSSEQEPDKSPEEVDEKRERIHDGFYLRMGAGFGYMIASQSGLIVTQNDPIFGNGFSEAELSLTGFGQLVEISFGGAVSPGVIIGGGIFGTHVFTTKATISTTSSLGPFEVEDDDVGSSTLSLICPFVNLYYDPKSGVNSVAGPCLALADFGDSDLHQGFGLNLGLGGEWYVADNWSVGFLLRFQYASVSYEDNEPVSVMIPGALFTATLN